MSTRIEIDTKTFVRFWLVLIGFVLVGLILYSARSALLLIAVAFFLSLALNAPVHYLASHLPGRSRVTATASAYVIIVVALVGTILLAAPPIVQQTAKFIQTVPELSDTAVSKLASYGFLIDEYHLQPQIDHVISSIQESASEWAGNVGRRVVYGAGSVVSFAISMFFVLVLTFLMLIEGPAWLDRIWGLYRNPQRMNHHKKLATKMHRVVTGYIVGQLMVASIGGLSAAFAVFMLSLFFDLPANLALPTFALTAFLSLIPMFGATFAGALVTLLIAFNSVPAAIAYVIFFAIYQQIENNVISPVIQARRLELSALTVLIAVTFGFYVFGVFGILMSIPVAGSLKVLVDDYLERKKHANSDTKQPQEKLVKTAKI